MHIPDSMLSPSTCAACAVAMVPAWIGAAVRVKKRLRSREVPLLALGAAFSFTIMMFNIPALGGTTAHPVAGTLLAVMLGPWAAIIGISVALGIQALFFGDGGILAYGANCFTMAFVLPMVGYSVYLLLSRKLISGSRFRPLCAGAGAYLGIVAASLVVAILLGIQPALFHEANGHAIYFPFGLSITVPAMLATHLLIAGPAEAIVTALAVAYLQAAAIPLYATKNSVVPNGTNGYADKRFRYDRLWLALGLAVAITPLGLLAKGDAWGEWDADGVQAEIHRVEGQAYTPSGIADAAGHAYKGAGALSEYGASHGPRGYLLAALVGAGSITLILMIVGAALSRSEFRSTTTKALQPAEWPEKQPRERGPEQPDSDSDSVPLPGWLLLPSATDATPAPEVKGKPANSYLARSVADLARRCSDALNRETWPSTPGTLQNLDARAKLFGLVLLIAIASTLRHLLPLVGIYMIVLACAWSSHLPVGSFVKRVWLAVPLFVGGIIVPVVINTVTAGPDLLVLWRTPHLSITRPGALLALLLIFRVGVAISLGALLTLTTHWSELMSTLRYFRVPRVFVDMLAMTYRYSILLMNTASEMFQARTSRTVGRATNAEGRRFIGDGIGSLFGKTLTLSEEIHNAMISRGFNGDMHTLHQPVWTTRDSIWILMVSMVAAMASLFDHWMRMRP